MLFTGRLLSSLRRAILLREFIISWLLVGMLMPAQAAAPTWWSDRGIIDPVKPVDDYAALNQGQLKNLVKAAVAEMNANLIGGAGSGLNAMVSAWTASPQTADDYAVVNAGQLKALALPLYQRLLSAGVITTLPAWTFATDPAADDFAVANIGQAKNLFSFSIPVQEATLPLDSPFVIKYLDWQSGQIRPGRGEPGDPPEIQTVYTGTKRSYKWVAGAEVTDSPSKQSVGSAVVTEFDTQSAADAWKSANDHPGEYYLRHTNVVEIGDFDEFSTSAWIYLYRDSYSENGSETNPTPARTLLQSEYVSTGAIQSHGFHDLTNVVEYEVTSDATWTEANVTSAAVAAHWFSQVAAGPASQPATGWAAEPETVAANVIARLTDPGPVIPYQDLPLPTAGGVVATAHSALSSVQQTYQNAQGQTVTAARYTGERSQGHVSIAWRQDVPLTDLQKQEWLSRYIVVKKTTTTGQSPPSFTSLPLSDYLTPGSPQSHYVSLSPILQSGVEQEIEFSVVFLDNPTTPPYIMQAVNVQQSVELGMSAPAPLNISLTQLGLPVQGAWITLEVYSGEGGVRDPSSGGPPQSSIMVQTNSQGYINAQFNASSTPGYTWLRASAPGAVSQWFLMTIGGGGSGEFPENPTAYENINFKQDSDDDGDSDADEIVAGTDPKDASHFIPDWKFRSLNIQFQTQYDIWKADNSPIYQPSGQTPGIYNWYTFRDSRILGIPTSANHVLAGPYKPDLPVLEPYVKPQPDSPGWSQQDQRNVPWETSSNFNPFSSTLWNVDPPIDGYGVNHHFVYSSKSEITRAPIDVNDSGPDVGNIPRRQWISSAIRLELRSSKPRPRSFSALAIVERTRSDFATGTLILTKEVVDSFTLTLPAQAPSNGPVSSGPIVLSYEPVMHCVDTYKVTYVPVEVESKDRFLTGAFDTSVALLQNAQVEFIHPSSGGSLGTYKLDGSEGTHIYTTKDQIFSEQELDNVVGGAVGSDSNKLNQKIVFWKEGAKVRFATTFDGVGSVNLKLSKSDGTPLGTVTHELVADANFSGLIDHLAARIDSINGPETDPFELMPEINGIPDDDDDPFPVLAAMAEASISSISSQESAASNSWSETTRNLLSKVLIPVRATVDGIKTGAEYTYKIGGGFVKGYVDGVFDGIVSDVTGVAELGMMALESLTGDFHRAKAMYDGIKILASMTSEQRGAVFDSMLVKFLDKSTTSVPWNITEMNGADEWGITFYMAGYGGGFITEQIVATMAVAGLVSKVGQGVKVALLGTKLGQLTATMIQGVRKFVIGTFLSVTKHVKAYGERAVRSIRVMIQEVATIHRNGKTLGEHFYEFMERITPVQLTFQFVADQKAIIYKTAADWIKVGGTGTALECALAADLGIHLTEHAMKGFLNLWKGALRDGATGHYMHHLNSVCAAVWNGTFDPQSLGKILEMFESTSQAVLKFIPDAQDLAKWISPAGLIYESGSAQGHRLMHLLAHTVQGYNGKTLHSVFHGARHQVFAMVDEAWLAKTGTGVLQSNGNRYWIVNMGRPVGINGQTSIKIIVKDGTNNLITAFPQ